MDAPTWLETHLFQRVLRKSEKDETIEVSNVTVKPATAKGDNYSSDMYRVIVTFSRIVKGQHTSDTKSLIVKVAPEGGLRETTDAGFFETEMAMMSETLPRMGQIIKDKIPKILLAAQCLHMQREKPIYLILEDLALRGFRMADRQAGLDLDHCLLAIRNLAAFHASSVALVGKVPEVAVKYKKGVFHKDYKSSIKMFVSGGIKSLGEEAAKWPELSPRISEKILKLSDIAYERTCEVAAYRKEDFNVINHGDFSIINMLFCYNEQQKPIDHTFVDFQISYYASPAVDLLYFFGTSSSNEVRLQHREIVLREYHTSLTKMMTKLDCIVEAPSFDNLKQVLSQRAFYEMISSLVVLPFILVDKSEAKSLNEMRTSYGKYENPGSRGKSYREVMTRLLPIYDSMGLLDL